MITIYIEEAHAADEWRLPESSVEKELQKNNDDPIRMHDSIHDRIQAAALFVKRKQIKCDVLCDGWHNGVLHSYQSWPERIYIIIDGVVVYQGGIGPFHYDLDEVETWMEEKFGKK